MKKNQRIAMVWAALALLFWSTVATAFKLSLEYMSVWQLLALANGFSALCLLLVCALQQQLPLLWQRIRVHWLAWCGLALLNPILYYGLLFSAYDLLPAQVAQAINYTWALMMSLLAVLVLRQPLGRTQLLALLLAYGGVLVLVFRGQFSQLPQVSVFGVLLALGSTLVWASYWLLSTHKEQQDKVPAHVRLAGIFCLALPGSMALMLVAGWQPLPWQAWLGAAYVGLFEMGLTFLLFSMALVRATSVSMVSNLMLLSPCLSFVWIALVLNEPIHGASLVGLGMILVALIWQARAVADKNP